MSVLAPPPSPTPSSFEAMLSDSDVNIERSITVNALKRKSSSNTTRRQDPSSSDMENLPPFHLPDSDRAGESVKGQPVADPSRIVADTPATKKSKSSDAAIVELKNGKLVMKQKLLNWALTMPVMKAIIEFQTFLTPIEKLDVIPQDRLHVVAKLVQESDKSLTELAKVIRNALMPEADLGSSDSESAALNTTSNKNKLTHVTVQHAILAVADRRNYGIDASFIASDSTSLAPEQLVPPTLQLWRWEVKDSSMLPKENLEKALMRRREREEAGVQAKVLFTELTETERQSLLSKGSKSKTSVTVSKELLPAPTPYVQKPAGLSVIQPIDIDIEHGCGSDADTEKDHLTQPSPSTPSASKKRKAPSTSSTPKHKDVICGSGDLSPQDKRKRKESADLSPEKMREREEKEAVKAERLKVKEAKRVEREAKELEKVRAREAKEAEAKKLEDRKQRQAKFLTAFVKKSAASSSPTKATLNIPVATQGTSKESQDKSDFDKTFLPCQYKDLAPINRFLKSSSNSSSDLQIGQDQMSQQQMLADFHTRALSCKTSPLPKQRRGVHPPVSVRDIKRIVTESDVLGGNAQERAEKALELLQDHKKVQMKLLQFESDRRPGWYGTWTKSTNLIGPRCPLGQDPVSLDYSYDSDAEWEETGQVEGEDVQDGDGEKDESVAESDDDSDMDDWLVDDLEEEDEEELQRSLRATPQLVNDQPMDIDDIIEVDAKGEPVVGESAVLTTNTNILHPKKKKKVKLLGRRFETKLVPFSAGPHWESSFGDCAYDHFSGYRIEFLNDACFGLNPFTFASAIEMEEATPTVLNSPGGDCTPTKLATRKAALPAGGVLASLWTNTSDAAASPSPAGPNSQPVSAGGTHFKHQLKEDLIPHLISGIQGSTKTRAGLIDDLKEMLDKLGKPASKNAIGERISTYAKKEKKAGSTWIIKDEFRSLFPISN